MAFLNMVDHVFIGRYDGDLLPNKDEVDDYKWVNLKELKRYTKRILKLILIGLKFC